MPCAEEIYRFTLERLAEEGNEQAKLALSMGQRIAKPAPDSGFAVAKLQDAQALLATALVKNDKSWNRGTDRCIHEAQAAITAAIIRMK